MASSARNGRAPSSLRSRGGRGFNNAARGTERGSHGGQWPRGGGAHIKDSDRSWEKLVELPKGHLLGTINASEVDSSDNLTSDTPSIKDVQYVASYSWLDRATPTIVVPGKFLKPSACPWRD